MDVDFGQIRLSLRAFKNTTKIHREDTQRDRTRAKRWRERKKKAKFWAEGGPAREGGVQHNHNHNKSNIARSGVEVKPRRRGGEEGSEGTPFWLKPFLVQTCPCLCGARVFCDLVFASSQDGAECPAWDGRFGVGANGAWPSSQDRAVAIGSSPQSKPQWPRFSTASNCTKRGSTPRLPQRAASVVRERRTPEQVRSDASTKVSRLQAALRSLGDGDVEERRAALPSSPLTRFQPVLFRVLLQRRLLFPYLTLHSCRCGCPLDAFGHHRAACSKSGVLGRRGFALESAAARVCRESGARVATNLFVRDMDLGAKRGRQQAARGGCGRFTTVWLCAVGN